VVEKRPPPLLGEHTQEILKERLHLSDTEIAQLKNKGII
jgi:crotonobetainyl-CoA:carnitine CoA-transferase CaiB-like acyl-CoA transferase